MTEDDYLAMTDKQGGLCLICKQPPSDRPDLDIDHDHETGKVRGLLCNTCNTAIGLMNDSPSILLAAVDYLKANGCQA